MTDLVDEAQALELDLRADALASRRGPVIVQPLPWPRECRACGEPIPIGRAAALPSTPLCIDCQAHREFGR